MVGGDKLVYDSDAGSPATDMLETKLLFNSTISNAKHGARFMSLDLKDMFLQSKMEKFEYMWIPYKYFPKDIINRYNLSKKVTSNGKVYVKINCGMYGLKQAAILAYETVTKLLTDAGYILIPGSIGLWKHSTHKLMFALCVDDFGVQYYNKADVYHLITTLSKIYKVTEDWTGQNFLGLELDWNYDQGYLNISMPSYIKNTLSKLQHVSTISPQYSPHHYQPIAYGRKGIPQYATTPSPSPELNTKETRRIQSAICSLLYYARALDCTMLSTLNQLGST